MNDLLALVLNDASAREADVLPALAADIADKFLPWAHVDEA